jgi:hypothetical protein
MRRIAKTAAIGLIAATALVLTGCAQTQYIDDFLVEIKADGAGQVISHDDLTYSADKPASRSTIYGGETAFDYLYDSVSSHEEATCEPKEETAGEGTKDSAAGEGTKDSAANRLDVHCETDLLNITISKVVVNDDANTTSTEATVLMVENKKNPNLGD